MVACIDTSGSVEGEREVVRKAIALGLLEIARLKEWHFVAILFSSRSEVISFRFGQKEVRVKDKAGVGIDASAARMLRKCSDQVISSLEITEKIAGRIFEAV